MLLVLGCNSALFLPKSPAKETRDVEPTAKQATKKALTPSFEKRISSLGVLRAQAKRRTADGLNHIWWTQTHGSAPTGVTKRRARE